MKEKYVITFTLAGAGIMFNLAVPYLIAASVFMLLDIITGVIKAVVTHTLKSRELGAGIPRKLGMLLSIVTGFFIDFTVTSLLYDSANLVLPFTMPVGIICSVWVILTEVVSIFENLSAAGAPVPAFLQRWFSNAKDEFDEQGLKDDEDNKVN